MKKILFSLLLVIVSVGYAHAFEGEDIGTNYVCINGAYIRAGVQYGMGPDHKPYVVIKLEVDGKDYDVPTQRSIYPDPDSKEYDSWGNFIGYSRWHGTAVSKFNVTGPNGHSVSGTITFVFAIPKSSSDNLKLENLQVGSPIA